MWCIEPARVCANLAGALKLSPAMRFADTGCRPALAPARRTEESGRDGEGPAFNVSRSIDLPPAAVPINRQEVRWRS